jgi:betaine-aldehyde dehydrogenase
VERGVKELSKGMDPKIAVVLPAHRDLYYDGGWHEPAGGYVETHNPATGESLGSCAEASAEDVDRAAQAAFRAFSEWRHTRPVDRAFALRRIAATLRTKSHELAMLDAANCGNPVREMLNDTNLAAAQLEYFAGLATEIKGETIPMGPGMINMTVREPIGVCARILAYNHPLMFTAAKIGAAVAAGNTVIIKPPTLAPLSAYRFAELVGDMLPPGVLSILTGSTACGQALVAHPLIPKITLIGSVPTGRAIARSGADLLKSIGLELGGKNALIVYPDADVERAIQGAIRGMNFAWCGQSCGSTSRLFVHEKLYEVVLNGVVAASRYYKPGIPTEMETTMGSLISRDHWKRVLGYIESGKSQGASLAVGGTSPEDPELANGCFIEPTIFSDVTPNMRIAREEIFGPVLSVFKWRDEEEMFGQVNDVEYGLTAAVYTSSLATAHTAAARIDAGYIWINNSAAHFLGAPFGGRKQSGSFREESIEELFSFTQIKNINITIA